MTTCASFKGMFFAFNQRLPTDQEIFDAGVREGIKRAPSHPENNTIAVLRREITELTTKLEAAKLSGFMNLPNLCTGSFERGGFHVMIPKRAFQSDASAAKAPIDSFIVEVHLHANLVRTFDKFHTLDEFYALFGETYLWMPLPVPSLFDNQHIESDAKPIPDPDTPGPWIEKIPEYEYELWIEGHTATGNRVLATYHGKIRGNSFVDAVKRFVETQPKSEQSYWRYQSALQVWTYWGARAFDNEQDARRAFG